LFRGGMIAIITASLLFSFIPFHAVAEEMSIDYIKITFMGIEDFVLSPSYNISTNFTLDLVAIAFNYTHGWIGFVKANWSVINNGTNASITINSIDERWIKFFSGWYNGIATLKANVSGISDTVEFHINSSSVSYSLEPGWNVVGIPYGLELKASGLLEKIYKCEIILKWNTSEQDFDLYALGSPYDFNVSGKAVLVAVTKPSIFSLPVRMSNNQFVSLYPGCNFLIWLREKPITAEEIYENITGCTLVLKWNTSMQDFNLYVLGSPNNFVIRKGEGFLVAVTEKSVWYA